MSEAPSKSVSLARRVAASTSLLGAAAIASVGAVQTNWWPLLGLGGLLGLASVGLSRKSLTVQILSRATAWIVFAPGLAVSLMDLAHGRADWPILAMAATSGAALALGRPMLETEEARAAFAPVAYRRGFLNGATAATAAGLAATTAAVIIGTHPLLEGPAWAFASAGLGALGAAYLASALGVLRLRTWGILLGAVASLLATLWAAIAFGSGGAAIGAAALIPGCLLVAPILLSRLREPAAAAAKTRVAGDFALATTSSRLRIADESGQAELDSEPIATGAAKAARYV